MTTIRTAALAAGLTIVSVGALAADLPQRPAPAPVPVAVVVPVYSWTGFYIGGNIGAGWAQGDITSNFGATWSRSDTVFIGGFQAGFNFQFGAFVLGVEGDFDFTSGKKASGFVDTIPYGPLKAVGEWNWLTTVAGRFGYAMDRALFYGKAGWGWSRTSVNLENASGVSPGCCGSGNTNSGFLLGAGLEYAFTNNWTAKVEYNWLNLSDRTFTITGANTVTTSPDIQMVKFGVNYKFGPDPVVARY